MNYARISAAMLAGMMVVHPLAASAQQKAAPGAGASQHIAVTEGVFDLRWGEVTDLTDRRVLLSFPRQDNRPEDVASRDYIAILINGRRDAAHPGKRINLKGYDSAKTTFNDMAECYLDLLRLTVPKGGSPVAQFRLHCR